MLKQQCPSLRTDLSVDVKENFADDTKIYVLQKPNSEETFEFGEEEFFLCQALDGQSTQEEIINRFTQEFASSISEQDFNNFVIQIQEFGLIKDSSSSELNSTQDEDDEFYEDEDDFVSPSKGYDVPRWRILQNADPIFQNLTFLFKPLLIIYPFLLWAFIPIFLICLNLWLKENILISESVQNAKQLGSFLFFFLLSLLLINFVTKVGRGIIATFYGANVQELGMLIRWGFVPRFYARISGINQLTKQEQLITYGSPLFFRGVLFATGTFTWYFNLGEGNLLSVSGILLAIIGLVSLIGGTLPIRPAAPGTRVLALALNKSANYPRQLMKRSLVSFFNPHNSQQSLSKQELWIIFFGLLITLVMCFIVVQISFRFALGLTETFPDLFGRGTFYIILGILLLLGFNYILRIFTSARQSHRNKTPNNQDIYDLSQDLDTQYDYDKLIAQKKSQESLRTFLILLVITVILLIPIPYSIGGDCQLLPPKQQDIQAPVSGKIEQVFYRGGDGILIKQGMVIADMISGDLENQILTLEQQIKEQEAQKQQSETNLQRLQQGSRREEIIIAQSQVDVARQEVNVASSQVDVARQQVEEIRAELRVEQAELIALEKQLQSAIVDANYSKAETSRLESLYQQGAFSLQRYEDSKQRAETDQIAVAEKRQNLKTQEKTIQQIEAKLLSREKNQEQARQSFLTKQKSLREAQAKLDLILSGKSNEEIEVARQEVNRSNADLNALKQQLKYTQEQNLSSELVMPFDGYLVESYLDKKVGSYLNKGENFATAQDASRLVATLEVPEYDAGEINIDVPAQVKLLAYPNEPFYGRVIAIEPTTQEEEEQSLIKIVNIQIELEASDKSLRPGMSGYGKIRQGKKMMIIVLTRPLVRFLQIEFWSWLP